MTKLIYKIEELLSLRHSNKSSLEFKELFLKKNLNNQALRGKVAPSKAQVGGIYYEQNQQFRRLSEPNPKNYRVNSLKLQTNNIKTPKKVNEPKFYTKTPANNVIQDKTGLRRSSSLKYGSNPRILYQDTQQLGSMFDLQLFPPGSRIIRIEPGMPIPNGAIPIPFTIEEHYNFTSEPRLATRPFNHTSNFGTFSGSLKKSTNTADVSATKKRYSNRNRYIPKNKINTAIRSFSMNYDRVPIQVSPTLNRSLHTYDKLAHNPSNFEQNVSSSATAKKSKFTYNPNQPVNKNNPYSVTGFFPSHVQNPTTVAFDENKSLNSPNTSHTSLNDTDSQSTLGSSCDSYNIQIQIPLMN